MARTVVRLACQSGDRNGTTALRTAIAMMPIWSQLVLLLNGLYIGLVFIAAQEPANAR